MATDFAHLKPVKLQTAAAAPNAPPHNHSDPFPCPRCNSGNTKFCYYNNYNTSQPRHFCKSCRRYWTQGGTLRDVPVGGGTRKSAKRLRSSFSSSSPPPSLTDEPVSGFQVVKPETASPVRNIDVNMNANVSERTETESFTGTGFSSLLNFPGPGNVGMGEYWVGLGSVGPGLHEMGLGLGRGFWEFSGVRDDGGVGASVASSGCNSWRMNGVVEGGFVADGEGFGWPELGVSTAGEVLK